MRNFYIGNSDAINTYAQSLRPDGEPTYLLLGMHHIEFYFEKTGISLSPGQTLPILRAMQGDLREGPA